MYAMNLSEEAMEQYRVAFDAFDINEDGRIDMKELREVMLALGLNHSEESLEEILSCVDVDGDGTIDFAEFLVLVSQSKKSSISDDDIIEAFRVFDRDGNGFISPEELRQILNSLEGRFEEDEIEEMINLADKNGDNLINYEEFFEMIMET